MARQAQREGAATTCFRLEDVDRACRNEQHRFPRYWEAWGALLATRGHRLTLRSTGRALGHLHQGAAPPATRGHLTVVVPEIVIRGSSTTTEPGHSRSLAIRFDGD